jgi:phenylalanyl-tRNA synthetase beta subunit
MKSLAVEVTLQRGEKSFTEEELKAASVNVCNGWKANVAPCRPCADAWPR